MTIRAVVFDIGGVLEITPVMDFGPRWEVQLGLSDGALGIGMTDVWSAGEVGEIGEAAVYQALRDRLGLTAEVLDAVMADMWTQYLGRANDDLLEYVGKLRPRYRTGLLSNSFVGAREREQAAYGLEDLVDDVIYSHEVGMKKPDPRMYALACARLDVEPAAMTFVDNAPRLVAGARECGINAILFENNEQVIAELEALGVIS